ncbi:MAG: ethanolamine ammonia-lyase subunit EutC [Methylovirgula sp.]
MNDSHSDASDASYDPWAFLRRATSARIALGRTGDALPTVRVLEFALAHARARDAVHTALDVQSLSAALADLAPALVESCAGNRSIYLQRPDLGRRLAAESRVALKHGAYDAVIVLADGLSATAVQQHGVALCRDLQSRPGWRFAPPVIARQARVALGDEIAAAIGADLVIVLIGERPGLSASDSLGAYLTFAPKPGEMADAERNCISNIRPGGLALPEAARRISAVMALARSLRRTGTELKEDAALALTAPHKTKT